MKNWIYVVVCALLASCVGGGGKALLSGETLYEPVYANGFTIEKIGESSLITVKNPWQGASDVDMQLYLRRNGEAAPEGFMGVVVDVPLKKVVCMSSSYTAFIEALGGTDAIVGVSGDRFITSEDIRARSAAGTIRDVGYDSGINYELIAALAPDLVMLYGVAGENSAVTAKLKELNINVMYIGDYLETTPLGKSEWIVAFGEMFDCRERAQEIFSGISKEYNEFKTKVSEHLATHSDLLRPVVMLNSPWRDTWFVPGDRSYIVRLINDAGGIYACAGEDSDKSRPISIEKAYMVVSGADVWLNPNQAQTIAELVESNPHFADIPVVHNKMVFNCTKRRTSEGGSDFWETGAVYPNVVLKDFIKMLHPDLLPDHQMYYMIRLE